MGDGRTWSRVRGRFPAQFPARLPSSVPFTLLLLAGCALCQHTSTIHHSPSTIHHPPFKHSASHRNACLSPVASLIAQDGMLWYGGEHDACACENDEQRRQHSAQSEHTSRYLWSINSVTVATRPLTFPTQSSSHLWHLPHL